MSIRTLFIVGCSALLTMTLQAEEPEKKEVQIQAQQLIDERVSELMADRVNGKESILNELATIDEAGMKEVLERESLMFPADELYASNWDNRYVNPFQTTKINFPDSYEIDCSSFVIPIDGEVKVTSKYGPRRRRMHRGIDLKVYTGDTIRAAFDGKVRIRSYERAGYGYYLVIRHPNGLETVYGHLSKFIVNVNDIVRAGDPIGLGGNTGRSTGSHLHFETRFLGQAIDPAEIIDFEHGVPHKDLYVFKNIKVNRRNSNIYTSSDSKMVYHRVKSGDTLGAIARKYGTTVNELCRLNGIKSTSILRVGQSLRCTAGTEVEVKEAPTPENNKNQGLQQVAAKTTTVSTAQSQSTEGDGQEPVYHRIESGDTLGAIAKKYGTTVNKLCELNGISKTTILRLGRTLRCS
ncbi:MAG: peptidoglycan DD-metalloendopeptidase family protein [Tannerellaceae bacterium]|nr:peptidoglycan DD-metalloendopeptidase family protein [Tannerellaceae bacterium]